MNKETRAEQRPETRLAQARYIAIAALIGILAGTVGSFFHLAIEWAIGWPAICGEYSTGRGSWFQLH